MKTIWCIICALIGATLGGLGAHLWLEITVLSIIMVVVGLVLGWVFAKLVPAHEVLIDLLS
jgi:uncharacterized membrane protein YhdT